jgi:hypothetical protein
MFSLELERQGRVEDCSFGFDDGLLPFLLNCNVIVLSDGQDSALGFPFSLSSLPTAPHFLPLGSLLHCGICRTAPTTIPTYLFGSVLVVPLEDQSTHLLLRDCCYFHVLVVLLRLM